MAEEKRSIEISYKANLKDLVGKLKTLPNITGQEAKKMVAQLDRQLKQAEGAAKKMTESQKKAAKAASDAFKRNAGAIKGVTGAADQASEKLEHVADSAGEVDRGFAAVALALGQVNPALGEAANLAADVAARNESADEKGFFVLHSGVQVRHCVLNSLSLIHGLCRAGRH